jgi:hypothetical protein
MNISLHKVVRFAKIYVHKTFPNIKMNGASVVPTCYVLRPATVLLNMRTKSKEQNPS